MKYHRNRDYAGRVLSPIGVGVSAFYWTPAQLGTSLSLWLDASDATTRFQDSGLTTLALADTDPVGGWKDKSGNARHVLQATAGKRPLLKLAIQNGLPIIRSDGTDDFLQASYTLNQPYTRYALAKWTGGLTLLDGTTLNTGLMYVTGGNVSIFAGSNVSTGANPASFFLATAVFNGASSSIRIDSGTAASGNAGASNPGGITLGVRGDTTTQPTANDYSEIIEVTGLVSAANDAQIRTYFTGKWGKP